MLRLKILALPSQTTLLFVVMILVVLAAVAASSLPGSPMGAAPPLALILGILTLRDFLMQPGREIETHRLVPLSAEEYPHLASAIRRQAALISHGPPPRALLTLKTPGALFAFGSFRRSYIGIGEKIAGQIERDLASPLSHYRAQAEAALTHELQHLSQRDVIIVGLARSLLKTSALFMLWSSAFFLGLITVAFAFPASELFQPEFVSRMAAASPQLASIIGSLMTPELMAKVQQAPRWDLAGLYVLNAHLPILITTFILFLSVWRQMLKVRELYADAATAALQNNSAGIDFALIRYGALAALSAGSAQTGLRRFRAIRQLMETLRGWKVRVTNFTGFHPTIATRRKGLGNLVSVLADPVWIGWTTGGLVLLLDLLLIGPFTLGYVAEAPGVVVVLVGFAAISFSLLPLLAADSRDARRWIKATAIATALTLFVRIGFHVLNLALLWIGVFAAPTETAEMLNRTGLISVGLLRGGAQIVGVGDLPGVAVRGTVFAVYLAILIAVTLPAALLFDWRMKRLTLTWYGLPDAPRRLTRTWWWISAAVALAVGGLWLPLVNSLVPFSAGFGLSVMELALIAVSLIFLILGGWKWRKLHQQYRRRCPQCGHAIPGWHYLGRKCESCGATLHEWLISRYGTP